MDGTNKVAVITTKLEWPNGITIDYTNDKLYWSDAHLGYIEYVCWGSEGADYTFLKEMKRTLPRDACSIFSDTQTWKVITDTRCTMETCLTHLH